MKISKFWLAIGVGYIFVNSLNKDDFEEIQRVLLTKIYQFEPKLLDVFYTIDRIINSDFDQRQENFSSNIQEKISDVENQIKQVKMEKLSKLLVDQVNKGSK